MSSQFFSNAENGVNQTSWGRVQIYNGSNYSQFKSSIKNVLEIACVWSIVAGDELKPVRKEDNDITPSEVGNWISRNERAMTIIVGSIDSIHRTDEFRAALATRSAAALWNEVLKLNGSPDGLLYTTFRIEFYDSFFDPENSPLTDFYAKMREMQKMLLGTDRPITDADILERILMSIHEFPAERVNWHGAEWQILPNKYTLKEAITILREAEKLNPAASRPVANQSQNFANFVDTGKGNRGQDGRSRGGSRGRGRGGINKHQNNARGGSRGRGHRGNVRGVNNLRNNHRNSNRIFNDNGHGHVGRNNCGFCYHLGHWQKDYTAFQKARDRLTNLRPEKLKNVQI
ncbi:hypothetical protein K3495_g5789 [Podosphaera aphanis]|nr:hypothetical protein K3495_g5789 [Podosphaera aphanis]